MMTEAFAEQLAITLDDLLSLPEDARFEIWNGDWHEMSPLGGLHHIVCGRLYYELETYARKHENGLVFMDGLIYLMNSDTKGLKDSFVPDVSFIHKGSIPDDWNTVKPYPGVPDLAIEAVSPGDDAIDVQIKIGKYLDAGTQLVWVVYPSLQELHSYHLIDGVQKVNIYKKTDTLIVGDLFPELTLDLNLIFALPGALLK